MNTAMKAFMLQKAWKFLNICTFSNAQEGFCAVALLSIVLKNAESA
jgi:hypothetical protein